MESAFDPWEKKKREKGTIWKQEANWNFASKAGHWIIGCIGLVYQLQILNIYLENIPEQPIVSWTWIQEPFEFTFQIPAITHRVECLF